jgi:hypothetical protein
MVLAAAVFYCGGCVAQDSTMTGQKLFFGIGIDHGGFGFRLDGRIIPAMGSSLVQDTTWPGWAGTRGCT